MKEVLAQERTVGITKLATGQLGQQRVTYQPQRHTVQAESTRLSTGHKLLSGLADLAQGVAQEGFKYSLEEAYREGETQRQLGYSEKELDSNWLTRPFTRGGWRDRNYMLVTAEWEQDMRNFIDKHAADLSPEEMAAELQEQMRKLDKHIPKTSMTLRGRQNTAQHLMQSQDSLFSYYTEQHQAQSSERGSRNVNAAMQSILSTVDNEYNYANGLADPTVPVERLYTVLTNGIENLAPELQSALRKMAVQSMYEDGHVTLADQLMNHLDPDNGNTLMTIEERMELGKHRTKAREKAAWVHLEEATKLMAGLDNLVAEQGAIESDELGRIMSRLYELGHEPSVDRMAKWLTYSKPTSEQRMHLAMQAYLQGNIDGLRTMGFSTETVGDAVFTDLLLQHKDDPTQAYGMMVQIQAHHGHVSPRFKSYVQESMTAMISAAGNEAAGDPRHVAVVQSVLDGLRTLDVTKSQEAKYNILAGMDEQSQAIFGHVLDNPQLAAEGTMQNAIARTSKALQDSVSSKVAPQQIARQEEAVLEFAEKEYGKWWGRIKALAGMGEASIQRNAQTKNAFDAAILDEARRLSRLPVNMYQDPEALYKQAVHNVQDRLITWHGDRVWGFTGTNAVLMPEGFTEAASAVRDSEGNLVLGGAAVSRTEAIEAMQSVVENYARDHVKEKFKDGIPEGSEAAYITHPNGTVGVYLRPTGAKTAEFEEVVTVTPEILAQQVAANIKARNARKVGSEFGAMHTVVDPTVKGRSMQMQVSGVNSAGLPEGDVYDWKQQLMQRENFRWRPYPDGKDSDGTQRYSVGFGHRLPRGHNITQHPTDRQLNQWFVEDTDNAINTANKIASQYGFSDDPQAVLAVASMVYQMGAGSAQEFGKTLQQIAEGRDYEGLVSRSKSWSWYTGSDGKPGTPVRVEDFLERIKHRFK